MIESPEHGCLSRGATGLVTNTGMRAEPLGALPLGPGQADAVAVSGLAAAPGAVAGRTAGGLPLNRPAAGGGAGCSTSGLAGYPLLTLVPATSAYARLPGSRPPGAVAAARARAASTWAVATRVVTRAS